MTKAEAEKLRSFIRSQLSPPNRSVEIPDESIMVSVLFNKIDQITTDTDPRIEVLDDFENTIESRTQKYISDQNENGLPMNEGEEICAHIAYKAGVWDVLNELRTKLQEADNEHNS